VPWQLHATLGLLVGAGSVCLSYTGQACYLPNWFVRRRGLAMSIAFSGVGVGSIVLFPALQALIDAFGWRTACTALAFVVLAVLAPLNLLLRRRPEELGLHPDGDLSAPPRSATQTAPGGEDWTLGAAIRTAALLVALVRLRQRPLCLVRGAGAPDPVPARGRVQRPASGMGARAREPGRHTRTDRARASFRSHRARVGVVHRPGRIRHLLLVASCSAVRTRAFLLWLMVLAQGFLGYGVTAVVGAIPPNTSMAVTTARSSVQ
jgi:hypothetical protein